jgi:hypothetical protein
MDKANGRRARDRCKHGLYTLYGVSGARNQVYIKGQGVMACVTWWFSLVAWRFWLFARRLCPGDTPAV